MPRRAVSRTSAPFKEEGILTRTPFLRDVLALKVLALYHARSAHDSERDSAAGNRPSRRGGGSRRGSGFVCLVGSCSTSRRRRGRPARRWRRRGAATGRGWSLQREPARPSLRGERASLGDRRGQGRSPPHSTGGGGAGGTFHWPPRGCRS